MLQKGASMNHKKTSGFGLLIVFVITAGIIFLCDFPAAEDAAERDSGLIRLEETDGQEETVTHIDKLGYEETIKELGRILAGASVTEAALTNARELKKFAEQYKKGALDE